MGLTPEPGIYISGNMETKRALAALAALAQKSRLAIFRLLVEAGPHGVPASAIGERLGIPLTTLSFHLSRLSHARLVAARRDSRSIIYSADYETMGSLMGYLTENCCTDSTQACRLPEPARNDAASTRLHGRPLP